MAQSYLSALISGRKVERLPLETIEKLFPDLLLLPFGEKETPVGTKLSAIIRCMSETEKVKLLVYLCARYPQLSGAGDSPA